MEREKFMQEARLTAHRILESKENGIMNLVQQAWAEGKRNAEVETLRAAIDEALDRREPKAKPVKDAVYPSWLAYLVNAFPDCGKAYMGGNDALWHWMWTAPIPADIAQKLGIEPKED